MLRDSMLMPLQAPMMSYITSLSSMQGYACCSMPSRPETACGPCDHRNPSKVAMLLRSSQPRTGQACCGHPSCSLLPDVSLLLQRWETAALGDANMRTLQKGDVLQLERKGYFIVDAPLTSPGQPIVLLNTPDGHTKHASTRPATTAKGSSA